MFLVNDFLYLTTILNSCEHTLLVHVCNVEGGCGSVILLQRVGIGGGTRGAGGPRPPPPDFKIYAFAPPQISRPEIIQHWLVITFKHIL